MKLRGWHIVVFALLLAVCSPADASAKKPKKVKVKDLPPVEHRDFRVEGGTVRGVKPATPADSLARQAAVALQDSLAKDSLTASPEALSARERKRLARLADTTARYSPIFRDTLPISRMCWISTVVPGFGQLHNKQYWKIPIAYATLAGTIWGFTDQNKPYKQYKKEYDYMINHGETDRTKIDPVQTKMIDYNTRRQLFMFGIYASWVYFVCDGAVNYPGALTSVKKATTLSTILPGAGQIYNKSYWKVPFVMGGFATMAYVIDWNNRGYKRFGTAYDLVIDGDDTTTDEFDGRYSAEFLRNLRDSYRRNRDLCIILTAGLYLLNIIDAHVDSQLKDYDISDDLSMELQPSLLNCYAQSSRTRNVPGMTLSIRF